MAGGGLSTGNNHRYRNHFIELQPFFAGVHSGNRPAENKATLAGGGCQRFTLGNGLFELFVGVIQNILQRLFTHLGRRLRYWIVRYRMVDDIIVVGRIVVWIDPTQLRLTGGSGGFFQVGIVF